MSEQAWELEFVENASGEDLRVAERRKMKLLSADGWELVSVANGVAYFKRPMRVAANPSDPNPTKAARVVVDGRPWEWTGVGWEPV